MTTQAKKPLTKAQARLLARLRQRWTLTCYQPLFLKRGPIWYASHPTSTDRESCHPLPAQALFDQGYIIKDGAPIKTMGGRLQHFKLAQGEP